MNECLSLIDAFIDPSDPDTELPPTEQVIMLFIII